MKPPQWPLIPIDFPINQDAPLANPDYFGLLLHCILHIRTYQFNGYVRPKIPNTVSSSSVIASTKVTRATMS